MKARFRIKRGWFGRSKVLLQVGYKTTTFSPILPTAYTHWSWRDATEEDLIDRALGESGPARASVDAALDRFAAKAAEVPNQ